jgi:hypothetical protein
MVSKEGTGPSKSRDDNVVEAVIPGTVTTFGANYLVPHGKRVYLSLEKQVLRLPDDNQDDESSASSFVITNGPEQETTMFLVERNNNEAEAAAARFPACSSWVVVKDPMKHQVIFTVRPPGVVYAAAMPTDGGGERRLFGISSSNRTRSGDCMIHVATEGLVNRQGQPIQLVMKMDLDGSRGAIFLMLPPGSVVTNKKNQSKASPRQLIARMLCNNDTENVLRKQLSLSSEYIQRHVIVELAPGVDMALVVAMMVLARHGRPE